ncbi:MAG: GxxExxY protein [Verrucomicrobiales bacterium]|nr:GxxExxY protein [Verrucomicrobiales bacterium]
MGPNDISQQIVDAAIHVHRELGPGLLETVYEVVMAHELAQRGFNVERQVPIPLVYNGTEFAVAFRADLLVQDLVIVELKSTETNHPVYYKQLRTQLVLAKKPLGLVLNFGLELMKQGITRIVNGLPD